MNDKDLAFSLSLSEAFKEPKIILEWGRKEKIDPLLINSDFFTVYLYFIFF